jgi:hypothetical protein
MLLLLLDSHDSCCEAGGSARQESGDATEQSIWTGHAAAYLTFFGALIAEILGILFLTKLLLALVRLLHMSARESLLALHIIVLVHDVPALTQVDVMRCHASSIPQTLRPDIQLLICLVRPFVCARHGGIAK